MICVGTCSIQGFSRDDRRLKLDLREVSIYGSGCLKVKSQSCSERRGFIPVPWDSSSHFCPLVGELSAPRACPSQTWRSRRSLWTERNCCLTRSSHWHISWLVALEKLRYFFKPIPFNLPCLLHRLSQQSPLILTQVFPGVGGGGWRNGSTVKSID